MKLSRSEWSWIIHLYQKNPQYDSGKCRYSNGILNGLGIDTSFTWNLFSNTSKLISVCRNSWIEFFRHDYTYECSSKFFFSWKKCLKPKHLKTTCRMRNLEFHSNSGALSNVFSFTWKLTLDTDMIWGEKKKGFNRVGSGVSKSTVWLIYGIKPPSNLLRVYQLFESIWFSTESSHRII